MTSLHRVFELERNNVIRFSSSSDSASMNAEGAESLAIDPWRPILALAGQGRKELSRALNWLNLLASGGVHISTIHLLRFVSFVSEEKDLRNAIAIIDAAFKNAWLNPVGRRDLLAVFSKLHVDFSSIVVSAADNDRDLSNVLQFIRRSLASCLLLFGCDRKRLIQLEMITDDETRGLLLRKRSDPRRSLSADPITIDAGMMSALERYIDVNHDDISCVVAIFFNALYAEASFMEAYEVDNFVLRNGQILAKSAWQLYNIQRPALYEIRASLLSRTIVVDSQPFRDISISYLRPTITWEKRLSAVARLFRIVQDVTNPALDVEGRHWRSSIANILCIYLSALWTDDKEEIRLAVKTSASSLLPAHVQALESCWVELLLTAPVQERVELVSFLLHVLSYFPHWQVLSWSAIIDTLSEGKYDITRREEDPNVISLRVTLLLISLHMITNGVNVNVSTLLKVKKYLADLVGFHNVVEVLQLDGQIVRIDFGDVPTVYDEATPCVNELTAIFDCLFSFELTPSMMTHSYGQDDKSSNLAVGSLFIDLILVLFCTLKDLSSLPVLTLKRTLESLCIIIYKHDFEGPVLVHLQHRLRLAVSRSLELIQQDIGYELRQVALSFIQGFIKQCDKFMGHVIYKVIEDLSKLITAESHHASDVLTVQAKNFLNDIFDAYGWNGLFANLFKRPLQRDFFMILKENFGNGGKDGVDKANRLLRDIMSRMLDFDRDSFQTALQNLLTYIEVVYREDYDTGTMTFVGQQLTQLARRMPGEDINLSPLFSIPSIVAENNQGKINAIIPYIENEIRFIFQRLPVAFDDVFRLFSATQSLQRRNDSVIFSNGMAQIVFDALEDGLRTKQKMQPSSLTSLLQLVIYDDNPEWLPLAVTYPRLFLGLADNALYFLQSYEWPDTKLEDAYTASLSAAMVIWRAIDDDARVMDKLALLGSEKLVPGDYRIRAWNLIALAALRYSNKKCATALLPLLPVFASIQFNALRGYVYSEAMNWDQATVNINHAYVAVKLWMLIACETARDMADGAAIATARVWNELWPPFETLAFNAEKQNGHPSLTLLISSSVADLFIFLHSLHTPLSLQTTLRIATLDRLKTMASMGSASRKVTRAIHNLSQPPISLPSEVLVDQASKEIVAAEKLRVLETKREVD
ncbi:hypothetical protein APHAL10511_001154 [Amanita phalloides]|nr:hypothetical protein APHAL10511_001154 [Amanita phalloides]